MQEEIERLDYSYYFYLGISSMNSKLTGQGDDEDVAKKPIAIFGYNQSLLSVDMKTKVVQYVERDSE